MDTQITGFSQRYQDELLKHLDHGRQTAPLIADQLGREALDLGLETLGLARLHKRALANLVSSGHSSEMSGTVIKRAHNFFVKALIQLEKTHKTAIQSNTRLRQHSAELTKANRALKKEITHRHEVEKALKRSEQDYRDLLKQSQQMQDQLRRLSHQILCAQEEERHRISIELHDEIAQVLTGINLHLATLTKEATDNSNKLKKKVTHTQRLVERSLDIIHQFAVQLRPPALDDLGLIPALHSYMRDFSKQRGLDIRITSFTRDRIEQLDDDKRTVFFRVAQEALTNVAKHAQASLVNINVQKLENMICMEVIDNGRSFSVKNAMHYRKKKQLGLIGMRERVEMVGGQFSIESKPNQGTVVRAEIPLINE